MAPKPLFASGRADDQSCGDRADGGIDLSRIGVARQRATQTIVHDTKPDDVTSLFRRTTAVGKHNVGFVLQAHDDVTGLGDNFAKRGAAKRIIRMDCDPQPVGKCDGAGHFAHAALRSAMVV